MLIKLMIVLRWATPIALLYCALCFFGSGFRTSESMGGNCYKEYPIDKVLYTKLFCEIKGK